MYSPKTRKKHKYKQLGSGAASKDSSRTYSPDELSCSDTLISQSPDSFLEDPLDGQNFSDSNQVDRVSGDDQQD